MPTIPYQRYFPLLKLLSPTNATNPYYGSERLPKRAMCVLLTDDVPSSMVELILCLLSSIATTVRTTRLFRSFDARPISKMLAAIISNVGGDHRYDTVMFAAEFCDILLRRDESHPTDQGDTWTHRCVESRLHPLTTVATSSSLTITHPTLDSTRS